MIHLDKGFKKVQIHIQEDYEKYAGNGKQIQKIVKIVAAMLDCKEEDILVNDVRPSGSVILVFSIKTKYARKLSALNAEDGQKLRMLKIDYLIVDEKTILLQTSKGKYWFFLKVFLMHFYDHHLFALWKSKPYSIFLYQITYRIDYV